MTDKEITERIIREIMGWDIHYSTNVQDDWTFPYCFSREDRFWLFSEPRKVSEKFDPLHSLDDAWMVVKVFREKALLTVFSMKLDKLTNWRGLLVVEEPARAICMAALEVIGEAKKKT